MKDETQPNINNNLDNLEEKLIELQSKHKANISTHIFKAGDRIQFKSWDELEKEFGIATILSINNKDQAVIQLPNNFYFSKLLKYLCNEYATIAYIKDGGQIGITDVTTDLHGFYPLTLDMIKPAKNEAIWIFTDNERAILGSLESKYKYIIRDNKGDLYIYSEKPKQSLLDHWYSDGECYCLSIFNHIFKSIKSDDKQVCKFRLFI